MYRNDPRDITTRFESRCAGCGATVKRGERAFYYPLGRKLYGERCGCAETHRRDFAAAAFDEAYGL